MLRVLSLNLQHGAPGAGASGAGTRPAGAPAGSDPMPVGKAALADADIRDPEQARAVLLALAEQIRQLEPDVVALQEVDLNQPRSGRLDQTSVLAEALGMPYRRFAATYAGPVVGMRRRPLRSELSAPGHDIFGHLRAAVGAGPIGYGNALLSRHPVSAWYVKRLGRGPASLSRQGASRWDPRSYRLMTASQRLMLAATVELPGGVLQLPDGGFQVGGGSGGDGPRGGLARGGGSGSNSSRGGLARLSVACVHLATRVGTAAEQLPAAWTALAGLPGAHVLAGDCNMPPEQIERLGVARMIGQGATFPAGRPERRIDHFLTDVVGADVGGAAVDAGGEAVAGRGRAESGHVESDRAESGGAAAGSGLASRAASDELRNSGRPQNLGRPQDSGRLQNEVPLLDAVAWGTRTFVVSDHAGTWVDLAVAGA